MYRSDGPRRAAALCDEALLEVRGEAREREREAEEEGGDCDEDLEGVTLADPDRRERREPLVLALAGLESRVRFLGFRDDVWAELRLADIVVIPSRVGEPFGNTAVEAALAARPLIVGESSGQLEATQGLPGVHRVQPGDASAIADAVRDIIAHWPEQRAQAEASARMATLRFDPEQYRQAIEDLIASRVRRSNRRGLDRNEGGR